MPTHKQMSAGSVLASLLVLALVLQTTSAWSIETSDPQTKPIKVTRKNSGPTYDIGLVSNEATDSTDDQVEKKKVAPAETDWSSAGSPNEEQAPKPKQEADQDDRQTVGQLHIRRIFLIPMARPMVGDSSEESGDSSSAMMHPMRLPFGFGPSAQMFPNEHSALPPRRLLGQDEASRSPSADISPPMIDPIRLMLDMMQQALQERLVPTQANATTTDGDLNREASGDKEESDKKQTGGTGLVDQNVQSKNETKEEVVEIEGKKYLKKSVINRHVGENIVLMTKRLIFIPLNETQSEPASIPASNSTDPNITKPAPVDPKNSEEAIKPDDTVFDARKDEKSETPVASSNEEPRGEVEETTNSSKPKATVSLLERMSAAIDKAAERIVEKAKEGLTNSTNPAPSNVTNSEAGQQ